MPAISTLQLKDYTASEVSFSPRNIDSKTGVVTYVWQGATFNNRLVATYSVSTPNTPTGRVRVRGKVSHAIMDSVDTNLKLDDVIGTFEFSIPQRATLTQRRDTQAYLKDFLADAIVVAGVELFENVY